MKVKIKATRTITVTAIIDLNDYTDGSIEGYMEWYARSKLMPASELFDICDTDMGHFASITEEANTSLVKE